MRDELGMQRGSCTADRRILRVMFSLSQHLKLENAVSSHASILAKEKPPQVLASK